MGNCSAVAVSRGGGLVFATYKMCKLMWKKFQLCEMFDLL